MNLHAAYQIGCAARVALMFCPECREGRVHVHVDVEGGESEVGVGRYEWIGMLW
jgi:hypothetical protein